MQSRWRLPLVLDAHPERSGEAVRSRSDRFCVVPPDDPLLGCVSHLKLTSGHLCRGNNLEVGDRDELPDFQLAPADDGQSRRLDPADTDHRSGATTQDDRRGAGE